MSELNALKGATQVVGEGAATAAKRVLATVAEAVPSIVRDVAAKATDVARGVEAIVVRFAHDPAVLLGEAEAEITNQVRDVGYSDVFDRTPMKGQVEGFQADLTRLRAILAGHGGQPTPEFERGLSRLQAELAGMRNVLQIRTAGALLRIAASSDAKLEARVALVDSLRRPAFERAAHALKVDLASLQAEIGREGKVPTDFDAKLTEWHKRRSQQMAALDAIGIRQVKL